jgi:tetratricopeptide (TPR) repeat protein
MFFPTTVWRAGAGGLGIGALFHIIFLSLLLMLQAPLLVELVTLAVMPDSSRGLKLLKVHTEAEKRVIQDDLPGAILEYESIIAEDPGDIEARFRLAELRYQNEEYRKSASAYEALLGHSQELDMDRHCSVLTRLSEIYAHQLGDVETARAFVQRIVSEYPDTRYADYAREHIDNL